MENSEVSIPYVGQPQAVAGATSQVSGIGTVPDFQTVLQGAAVQGISADEVALYDRQIRLWGMKAQELIRRANILLISIKALGNEVAKNLTLAGIGSLTILDDGDLTEDDLAAQFLVTEEDIGRNRAEAAAAELRKMNPRVNIIINTQPVSEILPIYFSQFDIVICTGQPYSMAQTINISCREHNVRFYAADIHGVYGYVFSDLILHRFTIEREVSNVKTQLGLRETPTRVIVDSHIQREGAKTTEIVTKQETFCPMMLANSSPLPQELLRNRRSKDGVTPLLPCLRTLFELQKPESANLHIENPQEYLKLFAQISKDKHLELQLPLETLTAEFLRSFIQNLGSELSPTAAYIGGQLAQDVINVLGQREQPIQNFLLFDGEEFKSPIYSMQPRLDADMTPLISNMTITMAIPQNFVQPQSVQHTNGVA